MSRKWTDQQADAIKSRRGSVLVSAAAGSGKTAVLVQRVIERITDTENPTDADRLLIVTFTKLAAGEMRERIAKAVSELLKKDPGNTRLIRQQNLLAGAKICTIDSFCASVVKENFELLDIAPDFRTADKSELTVVKKEALDTVLEQMYQSGDENFTRLVELLMWGTNDSAVGDAIEKLYEASRSFAFPDKWLQQLGENYENETDVKESCFGKSLLGRVRSATEYSVSIFRQILDEIQDDEDMKKTLEEAVRTDLAQCEYILSRVDEGNWDEVRNAVDRFSAKKRGDKPKARKGEPLVEHLIVMRDCASGNMKELKGILCSTAEAYKDDTVFLGGAVRSLADATLLYSKVYSELKKSRKLADFSDIMHMALSLLIKSTDEGWERTELAKAVSECYDEILIDEYQDTNAAQTMLFESISRNNIFRVGDVKQSIYSFRQAMPEIFMSLKESVEIYDRTRDNYPSKIILANNFRSRKGVTDIINFIFEQIMTKQSGDIDYNEEERLTASASYEEKREAATELHMLSTAELDSSEESLHEYQARYIASQIKRLISEGYTVKEGDIQRKVTYRDFAVLMRSVAEKGVIYADVFRREGIPCFTEVSDKFLTSNEIALVLNLLRIIDNPAQDIPLLSVLMSPLFGFSVDKVAEIRQHNRRGSVYGCLTDKKKEGDIECSAFLEQLSLWRSMSICLSAGELLNEIYEQTAIISLFDAVDKSGTKSANLRLLLDYAMTYEKSGYMGLSGFIRFIDRLRSQKQDLTGALNACSNADVVKIMTIHKSKGLEFPVCILANSAGGFNRQDEYKNMILNKKYGVAIKRRDINTFEQFDSVPYEAVKLAIDRDLLSEELRVLYVALTRAREKLMIIYACKKPDETLSKCSADISRESRKISPYAVSKVSGIGQWILTALLRHKDAGELRELANIDEGFVLPCESPLKVVISSADAFDSKEAEENLLPEADKDFLELVRERVAFRYKYEALSGITMKRTASSVEKSSIDSEYFASSKPAFLCEGGLTGAQKGTATHRFIQYADYTAAKSDAEKEIIRLRDKGLLSEAEAKAINRRTVRVFFESELFGRIMKSPRVLREKRFIIEVPINEIYPEAVDFPEEKVMIQGACDCAFEENGRLVIIDYKTDLIESEEEFREKYSSQLMLYKKAISLCTGMEVSETLLYSFHLSKEIEIK